MSFSDISSLEPGAVGSRSRLGSLGVKVKENWALALLLVGIVGDAVTTAAGVNQMGTAVEAGPLASEFIRHYWLGTPWALHEVAAAYALLEVGVGLTVIGALYLGRRHVEAVPGGHWFAPAVASVFVASTIVNLRVMLWWHNNIPNGGLV